MTELEFDKLALALTPRGSHTLSKRPAAIPFVGSHYVTHGQGATITTRDGREYIDWIGGLGATPLGHNHPIIMEAVRRQLSRGVSFSLPHELEVLTAERLVAAIPCAEQIRFVKTGSEACSAAVAIARAATGRTKILVDDIGYHGWHDQFRVLAAVHPGVPDALSSPELIETFTYNDIGDLSEKLALDDVACIMMEPARLERPNVDYLSEVVRLAHAAGTLVIFDEMILGGRHALAGGQEFFGVTPDMATFGKAFGAGFPLAFVAGPAKLMQHAWAISGTFSGDALALAACSAMLDVYQSEDIVGQLNMNGSRLRAVASSSLVVTAVGYGPHFAMKFIDHDQRLAMSLLVQNCAAEGVLMHPGVVNACAVMTFDQVSHSCEVLAEELDKIGEMNHDDVLAELHVKPYEDSARR